VLFLFGGELLADLLLGSRGQPAGQVLEVIPRPPLHGDRLVVEAEGAAARVRQVEPI
jgi:hypothetical protein